MTARIRYTPDNDRGYEPGYYIETSPDGRNYAIDSFYPLRKRSGYYDGEGRLYIHQRMLLRLLDLISEGYKIIPSIQPSSGTIDLFKDKMFDERYSDIEMWLNNKCGYIDTDTVSRKDDKTCSQKLPKILHNLYPNCLKK